MPIFIVFQAPCPKIPGLFGHHFGPGMLKCWKTWENLRYKNRTGPKTLENTVQSDQNRLQNLENAVKIAPKPWKIQWESWCVPKSPRKYNENSYLCKEPWKNWENPEVKARSSWQLAIFKFSFTCWIFCLSSTYAFLWFVFLSCCGPHLTLNLPLLVLFFFDVVFCFLGFFCYKETRKANFLHFYRVWVFCSPNTPFFKCFFLLPALVFLGNFLCFFFLFFFPFKL